MWKWLMILAPLFFWALPCDAKSGAKAPAGLHPEPQQRDPYNWQERHEAVRRANAEIHPEYVVLGDSITHHWGGEPSLGGRNRAPQAWADLFGGHSVVNMGFGFDYIDNAYYRIQDGELADATPRVIIILLGTNNLGHRKDSPEKCAANMRALLKLLRRTAPESKILLVGILPRREPELAAPIARTNALYKKMADNKTVFYVDLSSALCADPKEPTKANPACFLDTVHPNQAGYDAMVPPLQRALRRIDSKY